MRSNNGWIVALALAVVIGLGVWVYTEQQDEPDFAIEAKDGRLTIETDDDSDPVDALKDAGNAIQDGVKDAANDVEAAVEDAVDDDD